MFRSYVIRLSFRACVFVAAVFVYFFHPELFTALFEYELYGPVVPMYVVWALMMMSMIYQLLPSTFNTMGSKKSHGSIYTPPPEGYDKGGLLEFVKRSNVTAMYVLIVWACVNAVVAILYLSGLIGTEEIVLICLLFYVCDQICVVIWCPFQSLIMKNRCCVNCRIYDWGWFMLVTPLIFIRSFFSWSLVFVSLIILLRWEITFSKNPERFWRGSNPNLRCENCTDKICKIKKPILQKGDK